jgi:hypothetical protein
MMKTPFHGVSVGLLAEGCRQGGCASLLIVPEVPKAGFEIRHQ